MQYALPVRAYQHPVLKQVSCEMDDGVLTLRGRVPSYYLKQVAQAAVSRANGVRRIENRIEVARIAAS